MVQAMGMQDYRNHAHHKIMKKHAHQKHIYIYNKQPVQMHKKLFLYIFLE